MQKHLITTIRGAPAMPQSAQIRRWLPLNPIRQTNRQRGLEWARELAFYHRFKVALHTPLFSSISWVTVTEYLMRACGTRSSGGGADYTAPSKQHNTASTLHLMIPPELGRIARLPVLFLIGAFVLQWLAFSLRRIACVRGLSCFQTCLSWGVMQSACPRQSGKRANTFPTDHADVSVCPCQLAEQGHATVAWWLSFCYDEAYDPSS